MKALTTTAGLVLVGLIAVSSSAMAGDRVIYGDDHRKDLFDPTNDETLLELSQSTAILVKDADLIRNPSHPLRVGLPTETFKTSTQLCDSERFGEQLNPGFCSGFLVGPDLFVTAGHCITSVSDCSKTSLVFGFGYDTEGKDLSTVPTKDIYHCKSIVKQELQGGLGRDFAVIKLDRVVEGRSSLKLRRTGVVAVGDPIAVIGHPSGLPTKISDGAKVRKIDAAAPYFIANLDTYGGNSGSAVFNMVTAEVEGILVRGETDFDMDPALHCRKSRRCRDDACRGEDVTKTSIFKDFVPEL